MGQTTFSMIMYCKQQVPRPDTYSFSSAISACARCGQWQAAMELLIVSMPAAGATPNAVTLASAVSALKEGGQVRNLLSAKSMCVLLIYL